MRKYHIGIDIGSTCAKLAVLDEGQKLVLKSVQPTGWSSGYRGVHPEKITGRRD